MKIDVVLNYGEMSKDLESVEDFIVGAGRVLDKSCASDSIGNVVVLGKDGKFYGLCVEAMFEEIEPSCAIDIVMGSDDPEIVNKLKKAGFDPAEYGWE